MSRATHADGSGAPAPTSSALEAPLPAPFIGFGTGISIPRSLLNSTPGILHKCRWRGDTNPRRCRGSGASTTNPRGAPFLAPHISLLVFGPPLCSSTLSEHERSGTKWRSKVEEQRRGAKTRSKVRLPTRKGAPYYPRGADMLVRFASSLYGGCRRLPPNYALKRPTRRCYGYWGAIIGNPQSNTRTAMAALFVARHMSCIA
jgi:hypothetical protein